MYDPKEKLAEALGNAKLFAEMAISTRDRSERTFCERMVDLYTKIAQELEAIVE